MKLIDNQQETRGGDMIKTVFECDGCGATVDTGIAMVVNSVFQFSTSPGKDTEMRSLVATKSSPQTIANVRELHFCKPECAKTFLTTALLCQETSGSDPRIEAGWHGAGRHAVQGQPSSLSLIQKDAEITQRAFTRNPTVTP